MPRIDLADLTIQQRYRIAKLQKDLDQADNYAAWKEIALRLDQMCGLEEWKHDAQSPYYAEKFITARHQQLRRLIAENQQLALVQCVREGLQFDVANISHPLLFAHTFIGTKKSIEAYLDTMCEAILWIASDQFTAYSQQEKINFFESAKMAYGQPALMFSGGATLGLFHGGVCKALFEQGLLPTVFSGSSAGALMAGIAATRTDQELMDLIDGDGIYAHCFQFRNLWQVLRSKGEIADIHVLKRFLRENLGEYTFDEAFKKSGRHVSVVVTPYEANYQPQILNELTTPDVLLWSATLASCAVPLIFPPVKLTVKRPDGVYNPYMGDVRWVDGSVRSDFPLEKMARLYNINYSIACQVNPHIVPFMQSDTRRYSRHLLSWPSRLLRRYGKSMALDALDFARGNLKHAPVIQRLVDNGYGIIGQRYYGNINILGDNSLYHYRHLLSNPTEKIFKKLVREGERATWPKISHIETFGRIGKALDKGLVLAKANQMTCATDV